MEVFDETTGVEDWWGQDEEFDTGHSMPARSGGSDTNGASGSVPSAAQKDTQARVIESSQAAARAYATEGEETAPQWEAQGKPLGLANGTTTREQYGPEKFTVPQYTPTGPNRLESVRLDTETGVQYGQAGSSGRLVSHPHRKRTKDLRPGQDGNVGSVFKGNRFSGPELFRQAQHFVIQSSEFIGQKVIHNHLPSANEVLSALENPIGTSWDPARACLPGTRVNIIQDAVKWLSTVPTTGTAGLYVVADGVGTGKSSLAHTVAGEVHDAGYLGASFFFDQLNRELSTTRHLFGALLRGLCSANEQARDAAVKILRKDSILATAPPTRQFDYLFLPICQAFPQSQPLAIIIDALDEGFDTDLMVILRDRIPRLPPNVRIMVTMRPEGRIMDYLERQSHIHRCSHPLSGASNGNSNDVEQYIEYELLHSKSLALTPELKMNLIQKSNGFFLWTAIVLKHITRAHDPAGELAQILDGGGTEWWRNDGDAGKRLDTLFDRVIANLNSKDSKFVTTYTKVVGVLVTAKEPLSSEALEKLCASEGVSQAEILDTLSRIQSLLDNFDPNSPQKPILFLHLSVRHYLTERAPHPFRLNPSEHHPVLCYAALRVIDQETNLDNFPFLGFSKNINSLYPSFDGDQIPQHLCYAYKFLIDHLVDSQLSSLQPACINLLVHVLTSKGRELLETTAMMQSLLDVGRLRTWALEVSRDDQAPFRIIHAADGYFGEALHDVGRWLSNRNMPLAKDSLAPLTTYTEMCRLQSAGGFRSRDTDKRRLAHSLNSLAQCQKEIGDLNSGVVAIEEALPIWRGLAASNRLKSILYIHNRTKYKVKRINILFSLCHCLQIAEKYQEAVEAAKAMVKISRQLSTKNPNLYEKDLAENLVRLSGCLTRVEDHGPALAAAQDSQEIYRRLFASNPAEYEIRLANALSLFCGCLVNVEKHQGAVEVAKELVEMDRRPSSKSLNLYENDLAWDLQTLSKCLTRIEDHGPALAAAQESLQIYRRLFASNPTDYEIMLSDALLTFCNCLTDAEKHQEAAGAAKELVEIDRRLSSKSLNLYEKWLAENLQMLSECLTKVEDRGPALAAAQESLQIYRRLFASNPADYETRLSDALSVFCDCLVDVEKHQEAVEAAKELVKISHQLSNKNSNLHEKDLAENLGTLSKCLTGVEDHGPALAAAQESLDICRRLFATNPTHYEIWLSDALFVFRDCLSRVEKHQEAVGAAKELVEIDRQLASKDPNLHEEGLAGNLQTLSKCLTKVEDHWPAVTAAQNSLEIYHRLFATNPTHYEIWLSDALFVFRDCLSRVEKHQEPAEAAKELVEIHRQLTAKNLNLNESYLARNLRVLSECLTRVGDHRPALAATQDSLEIFRRLFASNPTDYEVLLSDALGFFRDCLVRMQKHKEAAEAAKEQAEMARQLTAKNPNRYERYLARNLMVLSQCLTRVEDHGPALAAAQDSLEIFRRLFASNPTDYEIMLSDALVFFRDCLVRMQKHKEAVEAAKEQAKVARQLTAKNPNLYESYLAPNLGILSECLTRVEDHGPALAAAQESLKIYHRLFTSNPTDYEIGLSNAVFTFRDCLVKAGKNQEAVGAAKALVKMNRQFASEDPRRWEEPLARSLIALSKRLMKVGNLPAAILTVQEAAALYRKLSCQDEAEHRAALEDSLAWQDKILSQLQDDSVESAEATPQVDVEMKLSTQI